ncbi:MAG: succinate dehydrogenase, hydrophobic membrane anchor protein [SAR92 clade bacterium]|uniref:Succinate dehydrogenase hydrophobic membrane anchor subunit n=1 Tax=SAR92 clade bacterium TaxID=2315479 RepID=A0A520MGS2_9GAMM|nr:MAG: succinate dehydrogenase, hydrophobic membrane anchor protein [SAR92 clade bacterium]
MVGIASSFSQSGVINWLVQRVSALVMTAYIVFITVYLLANPNISYAQWSELNSLLSMRLFSLLTMASIASHAWIGIWCVLTDYVTERLLGPKADIIRKVLQVCMIAVILIYLVWAIDILWGF